MKVYTKSGDKGTTALFGGTRISKTDARIEAYGTVDELNAHVGLLMSHIEEEDIYAMLRACQSFLFDIGSHLASDGSADKYLPQLDAGWIERLENTMDEYTAELPELKSFVMPRGNTRIAQAHVCRTVCRRAERRVILAAVENNVEDTIIIFLNRLSDYFFVLSRWLTRLDGIDEEKWNAK